MSENEDPWAQLVSTTDNVSEPVLIKRDKFIIGRSKVADLSLAGNKLASGSHCFIMRDQLGKVWLQDTSTNGTLINMTQKLTGEHVEQTRKGVTATFVTGQSLLHRDKCYRVTSLLSELGSPALHLCQESFRKEMEAFNWLRAELNHGDEIVVVYKKEDPKYNVAYLYQDLDVLKQEEMDETQELSSEMDQTLAYDVHLSDQDSPPVKGDLRRQETDEDKPPAMKRAKTELNSATKDSDQSKLSITKHETEKKPNEKRKDSYKTDVVDGGKPPTEGIKGLAKELSEPAGLDQIRDDMEENLLCIICQEVFHDCISLQPCLHSFCSGCYSEWMERSKECPSCRLQVDRINKNHMVNNLVEVYFKQHPEKRRPEADIKELDAKNKITKDMLKPPVPKRTMTEILDDEDEDDDRSESDQYSDSDAENVETAVMPGYAPVPFAFTGMTTGFGTPIFGGYKPPKTVCRQCAEYKDPVTLVSPVTKAVATISNMASKAVEFMTGKADPASGDTTKEGGEGPSATAAATASGEGTSTEAANKAKAVNGPPTYVCPATQVHLLCACCLQPMPDRRTARTSNNEISPQQCNLCFRAFCHQYWTCRKADCTGCLAEFQDLVFSKNILPTLILQNATESNIFKTYLEEKNIELPAVHQACMEKLDTGTWTSIDTLRGLKSYTMVCYTCGVRNFRDLVYNYRKEIPNDQFPTYVTTRPDCHWGRNCRTQRNKPHHAANFNHICDQTKF